MESRELDFSAGITDEVVTAYTAGQCAALALELNRATNWPLVAQCWGSDAFIESLGPRDELGFLQAETMTLGDPHWAGRENEEILRIKFEHMFALSPQGAVDVRGARPVRDLPRRSEPSNCNCPPTCVCLARCCAGGSGMYFVKLSPETALRLSKEITLPRAGVMPAVLAEQNYEAAAELVGIILQSLGRKPRTLSSPPPAAPTEPAPAKQQL